MLRIWNNFPPFKRNDQGKTVFLFYVYSNYTKHNKGLDGDVVSRLSRGERCSANLTGQGLVNDKPKEQQILATLVLAENL